VGLETHWRGQSDTNRARLLWVLVGSLLLHAPLTPLLALFGWLLQPPPEAAPPVDPITAIPVDLLEGEQASGPSKPPEKAPPPEEAPVSVDPAPSATESVKVRDAGVPIDAGEPDAGELADAGDNDAGDADVPDAGLDDAGLEDAGLDGGALADAGPPDDAGTGEGDAGSGEGPARDPIAMVGEVQKVAGKDPNVQVTIDAEKVRAHKLGPRIGRLLAAVPQWRDFLGRSQIDVIRDVDRLMIFAPQLVADSSELVAILSANVPDKALRAAVDTLVKADPARASWKKNAPVPTATAYADRAERVFVLPSPGIVVVAPPSAEKSAQSLRKLKIPALAGDSVVRGKLLTPANAARGLPIRLPASVKSIRVLRFSLTPTVNGGALLELEGQDESVEQAKENATALLQALRSVPFHSVFIQSFAFEADEKTVKGSVRFTEQQLLMLLSTVEMQLLRRQAPSLPTPVPNAPRLDAP
jgi:hypothetical protein